MTHRVNETPKMPKTISTFPKSLSQTALAKYALSVFIISHLVGLIGPALNSKSVAQVQSAFCPFATCPKLPSKGSRDKCYIAVRHFA